MTAETTAHYQNIASAADVALPDIFRRQIRLRADLLGPIKLTHPPHKAGKGDPGWDRYQAFVRNADSVDVPYWTLLGEIGQFIGSALVGGPVCRASSANQYSGIAGTLVKPGRHQRTEDYIDEVRAVIIGPTEMGPSGLRGMLDARFSKFFTEQGVAVVTFASISRPTLHRDNPPKDIGVRAVVSALVPGPAGAGKPTPLYHGSALPLSSDRTRMEELGVFALDDDPLVLRPPLTLPDTENQTP